MDNCLFRSKLIPKCSFLSVYNYIYNQIKKSRRVLIVRVIGPLILLVPIGDDERLVFFYNPECCFCDDLVHVLVKCYI